MAAERFPMIPYSRKRLTKAEMISSVRAFADVLATRRSVRQFSSEDVPDEVLRLAIAIAASSPSGANMQPWRFWRRCMSLASSL
jgi:hypothetical protein